MANYVSKHTGAAIDAAVEKVPVIEGQVAALTEEIAGKPLVYIDGVIPTTKDEVLAELVYECGPERWHAYITIKAQGDSTLQWPKKNFTIKLYSDEARENKLKKRMFGWPIAYHKYVLKANWNDHTHARNVISALLWGEIVASRPDYNTLPEELRSSPNNGAIDGYPIIVYTNGTYQGLYTWNIGKDDWMWGMDEDNPKHVLLCAEESHAELVETACNFRALWSGVNEDEWSYEIGTKSDTVTNSLNAVISCVKDTTIDEFKERIEAYLDVQSAIDYYLFACASCGIDSLAKNMLIATYNLNKWMLGMYDMDHTWGENWSWEEEFASPTLPCPDGYAERHSLLFEKIVEAYSQEMVARGRELRKTVLSYANIMSHFEAFCSSVGTEAYKDDLIAYPDIKFGDSSNIWQLRNFVRDRLAYFDAWLKKLDGTAEDPAIIYSLPTETVFSTSNDTIDTGKSLPAADIDFTIAVDMTGGNDNQHGAGVFNVAAYGRTGVSLRVDNVSGYYATYVFGGASYSGATPIGMYNHDRVQYIIRHAGGSNTFEVSCCVDGVNIVKQEVTKEFINPNSLIAPIKVGAADVNWIGTLHRFEVLSRYMTDDEVGAFIAEAN